MIKRLEAKPETYYQGAFIETVIDRDDLPDKRPIPSCGTIACLAGEAIICSERSVVKGITVLTKLKNIFAEIGRASCRERV